MEFGNSDTATNPSEAMVCWDGQIKPYYVVKVPLSVPIVSYLFLLVENVSVFFLHHLLSFFGKELHKDILQKDIESRAQLFVANWRETHT